jgi:hypothetical protein
MVRVDSTGRSNSLIQVRGLDKTSAVVKKFTFSRD